LIDVIHLTVTDYIRLPERSTYNHNYYRHKDTGEVLLEICYEQYNSFEIFREGDDGLDFLGSSNSSLEDGDIEIHPNVT
jgi:hypothetical protein